MSQMKFEPIPGKTLGAYVTGVDLANLDEATWKKIEDAFHLYAVLVFPDQNLSAEAQAAFGRRFGEFEGGQLGEKGMDAFTLTNKNRKGELFEVGSKGWLSQVGNEGWHMDSTYTPVSSKAGLLSAQTLPSWGGETAFADMRAGYDALDQATKDKIENLITYNALHYSQAVIGAFGLEGKGYGLAKGEAYAQPMVKVHPVTGRKALFIGRHSFGIPGMDPEESENFIKKLLTEATTSGERTFEHTWKVGDIAVWDNRCISHRARPYDYTEPRAVRGTRIAGGPSEQALEVPPSEEAKQRLFEELDRVKAKKTPIGDFPPYYLPRTTRASL